MDPGSWSSGGPGGLTLLKYWWRGRADGPEGLRALITPTTPLHPAITRHTTNNQQSAQRGRTPSPYPVSLEDPKHSIHQPNYLPPSLRVTSLAAQLSCMMESPILHDAHSPCPAAVLPSSKESITAHVHLSPFRPERASALELQTRLKTIFLQEPAFWVNHCFAFRTFLSFSLEPHT